MRIDVGRVDEQMRAEKILDLGGGQFDEIVGQFLLGVAPGEICIGLREADFRQAIHHLRPREGFRQENHIRVARAHVAQSAIPRTAAAWCADCRHGRCGRLHRPRTARCRASAYHRPGMACRGVEIDVDDVFVFLRRIFGVTHGAVRPPVEPFWVFLDPGMVGRALNGEIKRKFEAVLRARRRAARRKSSIVPSSRVDGVVAAFVAADRVRAADIVRLAAQAVVLAFAVCFARSGEWACR